MTKDEARAHYVARLRTEQLQLKKQVRELAEYIEEILPQSEGRGIAKMHLKTANFWANEFLTNEIAGQKSDE